MSSDTIAAIATPPGSGGGIGIIRVSGPEAVAMVSALFSRRAKCPDLPVCDHLYDSDEAAQLLKSAAKNKQPDLQHALPQLSPSFCFESHRAVHGYIFNPETLMIIDEVIVLPMLAPRSYTAEDVVEIQAHCGHVVLQAILNLLFSMGVRPAEPGEFTKRAFLNGRIDLSQAEAVMDIINARSVKALKIAVSQGLGHLREEIAAARNLLVSLLTQIEAAIDFPDEAGELIPEDASALVGKTIDTCVSAIEKYENAGFLREGIKLAICGPPNVGKSSIMNRLLEKECSIVTEIPGTTRDLIEDHLNINGIPFVISDTAGMHTTDDPVEKIGIEKARKNIRESDIVLFVHEAGTSFSIEDINGIIPSDKKIIIVCNKKDNEPLQGDLLLDNEDFKGSSLPVVATSALYNRGIDNLRKKIVDVALGGMELSSSVVPNTRHMHSLKSALESLEYAHRSLCSGFFDEETLAIDIRNGIDALGEITGDSAGVDILEQIFSRFCIGK
ncbi:tRNA modification GTPase MnmE [Desulfamplus magnetovallimortis]|uniref:tRNA modification GTPase MnmE n=1 Tax=Desulfamplus magnetovallimortis TaxID=1246637 RepID=A0A1W1H793_9BACT|nr:tRNA uridine-5-carboxymethylaminomethyl(34) synthesis GTPase MnmE [Desulfamplus magnetovallimortis]SLM28333.1 tRNA modification GTPase MnmE [Desulfamplus magnetovallimortis]